MVDSVQLQFVPRIINTGILSVNELIINSLITVNLMYVGKPCLLRIIAEFRTDRMLLSEFFKRLEILLARFVCKVICILSI